MKNNQIWIALFSFLTLAPFSVHSQNCNPIQDSLELVKIYLATNGPSWNGADNWLSLGQPIESWQGVQVNQSGCVTSLNLQSNNLSGGLPEDLSFPELITLNLSFNNLNGPIPNLNGMPQLNNLILRNNFLDGTIPNFDGNPNLETLVLSHNGLIGPISGVNSLENLTSLVLSFNQLTGEIPPMEGSINMINLELESNRLTGQIPTLSHMVELSKLSLSSNLLHGPIPPLNSLSNLNTLQMNDNSLFGPIPEVNQLTQLRELNLSNNKLTGEIPEIDNLVNLEKLFLDNNYLSGQLPKLSNLINLVQAFFDFNELTGSIPNLNNLGQLSFLSFSNNRLSGSLPVLSGLTSLRSFNIQNNRLNGSIPDLSSLTQLNQFNVSGNNFTGLLPSLNSIIDVDVSNNLFTSVSFLNQTYLLPSPQKPFFRDTLIRAKSNFQFTLDLEIDPSINSNLYTWYKNNLPWTPDPSNIPSSNLIIFENPSILDNGSYVVRVTNSELPNFELVSHPIQISFCSPQLDSTQLTLFYLAGNGNEWADNTNWLSSSSISEWNGIQVNQLGCVQSIDLSNNNINATCQILEILDFESLDSINLSYNNLYDTIPLLRFSNIQKIDLSNNKIEGAFSNLPNLHLLKELYLNNNRMSGPIPPDLGDLCELNTLRLDQNLLSGILPKEIAKLYALEQHKVNFSSNLIDSINYHHIWLCGLNSNALDNTPSQTVFQNVCENQCVGLDWIELLNGFWLTDTLQINSCIQSTVTDSDAGFAYVRNQKLIYIRKNSGSEFITSFYDCSGNLLERIHCDQNNNCSNFFALNKQLFDSVVFELKWTCWESIPTPIAPQAAFYPTNSSGCDSLLVQYINLTNPITSSFYWSFPGGVPSNSTSRNPLIQYSNPGEYSATLISTNPTSNDTSTIEAIIRVFGYPKSIFSVVQDNNKIKLTNLSKNSNRYLWDFGNGDTSTEFEPEYTYPNFGDFQLTLFAFNDSCMTNAQYGEIISILQLPVANLSVNANSGCVPLTVQFINDSQNSTAVEWHFPGGEPEFSSLLNPTVVYNLEGSYDVQLTAINNAGSDVLIQTNFITVHPKPVAAFTHTQVGLTVMFENNSLNAEEYLWDFGNGEISTEINPVFTYSLGGTYNVSLSAINNFCGVQNTTTIQIVVNIPVVADFSISTLEGCVPLTVQFTNLSSNADFVEWNFPGGDPSFSNQNDPIVTYYDSGNFDVSLIASNQNSSSSLTQQNIITTLSTPVINFFFETFGLLVNFMADVNQYNYLSWDFGDGYTSEESFTSHLYESEGSYLVSLFAKNECGFDKFSKIVKVESSNTSYATTGKPLEVFPNPTAGVLLIRYPSNRIHHNSNLLLQIINGFGIVVHRSNLLFDSNVSLQKIDLTNYPDGMYTIKLTTPESQYSKSIIKITRE